MANIQINNAGNLPDEQFNEPKVKVLNYLFGQRIKPPKSFYE